jgi:hypothetical protein
LVVVRVLLIILRQAEPATESVGALFDREHSLLVERLRTAKGTAVSTGVLGKDAHEIAGDRRL